MAAVDTGTRGRAPACLCVLCGLPAAGKSTLARRVLEASAEYGWRATVVPYDDLIPGAAFRTTEGEHGLEQHTHTEWRSHRRAVLQCLDQILQRPEGFAEFPGSPFISKDTWERCLQTLLNPDGLMPDGTPLLFLLDDNFYYPSMRYEVFQLARKHSLGFCQVSLQCDLDSCISRNQKRARPVPDEVITDMTKRLEPPNPQKNSWEMQSITLNTRDGVSKCDLQRVMELISLALGNPLNPLEDDTEQKEADRIKCATSVVHQADQACRRLITEAMKSARENQVPSEQMRSLAAELNESKVTFLNNLRKQVLQEAPFLSEEDIDVEHVVKRAVWVFDDSKNEILTRFIKRT
ncbi:L-seryl-tRNA(Sec) kinase [Menidia menidia]